MGMLAGHFRNNLDMVMKVFLFMAAVILLIVIFPREGKFKYEFQKGKPWLHDDLYATFDFPINKTEEEVKRDLDQALLNLKPYFNVREDIIALQKTELEKNFTAKWIAIHGKETLTSSQRDRNYSACTELFDSLYKAGIIELNPAIENKSPDFDIVLLKKNVAAETQLSDVYTLQQADIYIRNALAVYDRIDRDLILMVLTSSLAHNIFFDAVKTDAEREGALNQVSLSKGMVQKGQLIITKGRIVSSDDYRILLSLQQNYETQLGSSRGFYAILAGQVILVSISILVLVLFLYFYRKDILANNKKIFLILLLIILMVFATSLVVKYDVNYLFLVPVCVVPVVVRAFFDTRLALFVHLITIILTGFLVPNSFQFVFLQLIAGIIAIMSVVRLERRAQFFYTVLWVFLTYLAIYLGLALIQEGSIRSVNTVHLARLAGNAGLILVAYPLIFILEKLFGIITEVTLMELGDSNNKLLRELAQKAPGTFQHSLQVANIAEEAIYAIGGSALLVRVGALYHDIGKMEMPVYFIENQVGDYNPHEELGFEESAKLITSHVIRGIEKARKYNLPEEIIDFIRTHHGTKRTEYFYVKQKQEFPDEEIDDRSFTYPGPVPFSRETAVLMMADSVEAASRSLQRPDEARINELVDKIIDKQVELGQFSNAPITLRDITKVRKILKKKLMNIYHVRVAYPE